MELPVDYPGADPEIELVEQPQGRVDPERGLYYARTGKVLELADKRIDLAYYEQLANEGKPSIPLIEVIIGGKHKQLEPNPNHEGYKIALEDWEYQRKIRLMRYCFAVGIKGEPDDEYVQNTLEDFPRATRREIKYLWVTSQLTPDDYGDLTTAILGRIMPTAEGMQQVANSFRRPD